MKVERRDGSPERSVLIAMIVSKHVLAPVADRWKIDLFASKWASLIGGWCVEHYRKYHRAPGKAIETYFREWADGGNRERETVEAVETLLAGLSDEAVRVQQTFSPDHLLDVAAVLFERVHLNDLFQRGAAHIERGEVDKARTLVEQSRKLEIGMGAGINLLEDAAVVESAFEQRGSAIVEYPGAVGNFFDRALGRDQFVAFLGKEKVGKSRWLLDVAWRGVEQNRNVAYFEMGDLSQAQLVVRFGVRASNRPAEAGRYPVPTRLENNGDETPDPDLQYRTAKDDLTADAAIAALKRIAGENPGRLKLSCHPAGSLSVPAAESVLDGWARDGFTPDIVIFDYADLAAPVDRKADKMEQTNDTWLAMRGVSQRLHCLVLTATQCNRDGFYVKTLRREHVGGYHMKLAHVTAMFGINQLDKEKELGLYRLNCLLGRELTFTETTCVWCAGALAVGNPVLYSTM